MNRLKVTCLIIALAVVSSGTICSATTVHDFLANASSATWSNPIQTVAYGGGTGVQGVVNTESGYLEDGNYYSNYLFTQPDSRTDVAQHYICGAYQVPIPDNVTNIKFTATVGLKQGAGSIGGMAFRLMLYRYNQWTTLCSETEYYDGIFSTMTANLSGYEGETLNLYLVAGAYGDPNYDWGVWRNALITADTPTVFNVSTYGAIPNDANDDYTAIQNAIQAAINSGSAAKVSFATGEYKLSNKLTVSGANNGLMLKGVSGTIFTPTNRNYGVLGIDQSTNVSLENITVDYDPLPFTQGTISGTGSGYSVINIDSGYPYIDDGWLWPGQDLGQNAALLIDPNIPGRNKFGSVDIYQITNVVKNDTTHFKLYGLTGAVGDRAVFWRRVDDCISVGNSEHVLFRNVNLYSGIGPGSSCGNTEKVFYRGCNFAIKPGSNRMHSFNADGAHIQGCKNGPEIVNCLFEGMNDDAVNLYNASYPIQARYADDHYAINPNGKMLTIGDTLVFFRPSNGTILGHAKVINVGGNVTANGYNCLDVTIDPSISGVVVGDGNDQAYDESWMSGNFLIANSTFKNLRGTLRAKTHDGVIDNNTIQGLSSTGLLLENECSTWVEGLQPENITISNNSFTDCGISGSFTSQDDFAVVKIAGCGQGNVLSTSKLPRNISIVANSFTDWQRNAIYAGSTANLDIHGNTFNNIASALPHPTSGHMGIMLFDKCTGVEVWDNNITDNRPSNQINGKLFASSMNAADIVTSDNSYTVNTSAPEITWLDGSTWETGVFRMSRTLAGDWSDSANPTGGWRYGSGSGGVFSLLSTHQSAWLPGDLGANQPAWANSSGGVPGWCKSIGASGYDFPAGRVGCHGPAIARWVASQNGIIQLSGGVWQMRNLGRGQTWELRCNGTTFTSGSLNWGPTSASPLNFTTGSGGSGALTRTVLAGDIIELYIHKAGAADDFVGTDITVTYAAWDAKSEWSDGSNPNGVWSYGGRLSDSSFDLLSVHQSSWLPGDLGANQPAWADTSGGVPGWCRSIGASSYDFPAGRVGCHGSAITRWTSDFSGTVAVSGGIWLMRNLGRDQYWELRHNGIVFTSGGLTWGPTSSSPLPFASGYEGVDVLTRSVQSGDNIDLHIYKAGTYDDFVGTDFTINKVDQVNGAVSGTVTDSVSGAAIQGATVQLVGTNYSTTTVANGTYTISNIVPGFYSMSVAKSNCYPVSTAVNVVVRTNATRNVQLVSIPPSPHAWDVEQDFSTTRDPNGPWTFGAFSGTAFGATFDGFTSNWISTDWTNTPGWFQSLHQQYPGVALSNGSFYLGTVPSGRMASYIPAAVKWTAPRSATISILGGAWNPRSDTTLGLVVKGLLKFNVVVTGRTAGSPYNFADAIVDYGGLASDLQNISVNMGDTIMVLNGPSGGDYMGFDFIIAESGATVFSDNFATAKKAVWRDDAGTTTVSGGELVAGDPTNEVVVSSLRVQDATAAVDFDSNRQGGLLARYLDTNNFVLAFYSPAQSTIAFHEKVNGNWGSWLAPVSTASLTGTRIRMTLQVSGNLATVTCIDEYTNTVSTSTTLSSLLGYGLVGIYHDNGTGLGTQYFDNFAATMP